MSRTDTNTFEQLRVILRRHIRWSHSGNGYVEEALELIEKTLEEKKAAVPPAPPPPPAARVVHEDRRPNQHKDTDHATD